MRQTKTIGSILLDVELVTQKDIEQALELQRQVGKRLGEVLVSLGVVSDDDIRWALAEQLNLPYVNIRKDQIDTDVATLIPEKLARRYHVIPILKIDDELTVVVDDPLNTTIIKDIERITRYHVKISLGRTSDILLAIDEIYGSSQEEFQIDLETPPRFVSSWFDEEDIQKILNDPSGHVLMERILATAFERGVSRIYFQPGDKVCHVSYRVNGVLQEQIQLSKEWYSILLFRLKISADFDIMKVRRPQYQEFSYQTFFLEEEGQAPEQEVSLAVSILPLAVGESVMLTVINKSVEYLWTRDRDENIPEFQQQELIAVRHLQDALHHLKSGAVLFGGAPYADKITTLYSLLNEFNPVHKKIVTLESSSEYRADKYYQIRYAGGKHVHLQAEIAGEENESSLQHTLGLDDLTRETQHAPVSESKTETKSQHIHPGYHAQPAGHSPNPEQSLLSAWLSVVKDQDADVLLVDRISSDVVFSQCLDFAAHSLLFASLDLTDAFEILAYLLDCQIKLSVVMSRVYALIAQQSIRILCDECKQEDSANFERQMLERLFSSEHREPDVSLKLYIPGGCPACHMTGYVHHVVIFEILQMEPWVEDMLRNGTSLSEIRRTAKDRGFISLKEKSLELLASGQTSLEEVLSIVT